MRAVRDIIRESASHDELNEDAVTAAVAISSALSASAATVGAIKLAPKVSDAHFKDLLKRTVKHGVRVIHNDTHREGTVVGNPNSHSGKYTVEWGDGSDSNHHAGTGSAEIMPKSYFGSKTSQVSQPELRKPPKSSRGPTKTKPIIEPEEEVSPQHPGYDDALEGLKSLGMNHAQATHALNNVNVPHDQPSSELIKAALKSVAKA